MTTTTSATATLVPGAKVLYHGRPAHIESINVETTVLCYEDTPSICTIWTGAMSANPFFVVLDVSPALTNERTGDIDLAPEYAQREAYEWEEHVLEVTTGYRSGSADRALAGEPLAQYAPDVPLEQRYKAKAAQLGVAVSCVKKRCGDYWAADGNPAALLDGRSVRRKLGMYGIDRRWLEIAARQVREHPGKTKITRKAMLNQINQLCQRQYDEDVQRPSRTTGYAALAELAAGRYTFGSSVRTEKQVADSPSGEFHGLHADYPTQLLMLDTHYLDVIGIDRLTGRWVNLQLTLLMDVFCKKVPALILTERSTDAFAVMQLLYRYYAPLQRPKYMQQLGFLGIPEHVVYDVDKTDFITARRQTANAIIPDNAKIFIGKQTVSVLRAMHTDLRPARVKQPTDKGPCERLFETVEYYLQDVAGQKGGSVNVRGDDIENQAAYYVDELEEMICDFLAKVYHTQVHDGILLPDAPHLKLSPNTAHDLGVRRSFGKWGLSVPSEPDLLLRLLPLEWRTITTKGVQYQGLQYSSAELPSAGSRSGIGTGPDINKFPVRVNPWDMRFLFLEKSPGHWIRLTWNKARYVEGPFTERTLSLAKQYQRRCDAVVDDVQAINEILHKFGAGVADTPQERRAALEELRRDREPLNPAPTVTVNSDDQWDSPSDADTESELPDDGSPAPTPDEEGNYNQDDLDAFYRRAAGTTADDQPEAAA